MYYLDTSPLVYQQKKQNSFCTSQNSILPPLVGFMLFYKWHTMEKGVGGGRVSDLFFTLHHKRICNVPGLHVQGIRVKEGLSCVLSAVK